MQPHRPAPPEPPRPSDAATPAEPVTADPTVEEKPDLAAVLKDAEACLAEAEKRIRSSVQPEPYSDSDSDSDFGSDATTAGDTRCVETETQPPATGPHVDPVAAKDVETCFVEAEPLPTVEPAIALAAVLRDMEAHLAKAEERAAEQYDACLRAKAETENVRRRAQEEIAKTSKFAAEKFAAAMLPVKDSLEAALTVEGQTLEKLHEGVELTLRQLIAAFESANLIEENPLGQRFDPNKHEAIGVIESEAEPNTVVHVLQKGYLLHGRIIRPAMVMVSKAR